MAKQIAISDEVYSELLKRKKNDKSFSEVIKAILLKEKSFSESNRSKDASARILNRMKKGCLNCRNDERE
ncbi:MAG: antitoxin VapB family protein [Candidatus Marsarchaeota archaeon]|nr:antitoxin VapB family protein [Candidatus Marsarchaeota archaeon]